MVFANPLKRLANNNNRRKKNNMVNIVDMVYDIKVWIFLLFIVLSYVFSQKIINSIDNNKDCKSCTVGNCKNCISKDMFFTRKYIPTIIVVLFVIDILLYYGLDEVFSDIFSDDIADYILWTINILLVALLFWYTHRFFHSMRILRKSNCDCIKPYKKRLTFLFISSIIMIILAIAIYVDTFYRHFVARY